MNTPTLASSLATLALLPPSATRLALAAQVADAGRRHLAPIPSWVTGYLERCLSAARIACLPKEQLVEPLLTLHLLTGREAYELEAISIINACYRHIADLATTGNPIAAPLNVGMHPGASAPRPESGKRWERRRLAATPRVHRYPLRERSGANPSCGAKEASHIPA